MFATEVKGFSWTQLPDSTRGRRHDSIGVGTWVVEHVPTGRVMIGSDATVSRQVDAQIEALYAGKHPSKLFNRIVQLDPELKLYEYPHRTLKAARAHEKELRASVSPRDMLVT